MTVRTERFQALVARRFGLQFEADRLGWLDGVLQRQLDTAGIGCEHYLAELATPSDNPAADDRFSALVQELTVPETYFFRHLDQLRALRDQVLPGVPRGADGGRCLRVLSAGCASGEEAYSIAMLLREALPAASCTLAVLGLDLNPEMIERARRARYSEWSLRETPQPLRERWFQRDGADFVLDAEARGAVRFEQRNLCADDPAFWQPGSYDVVFCRNVLMYLTPDDARAVVARFARALVPGGHLFLGHAETLRRLSDDFDLRHTHDTFYYQRKPGTLPAAAAPRAPAGATEWVQAIDHSSERIRQLTVPGAPPPRADPGDVPGARPLVQALELFAAERFTQALDVLQALPPAAAPDPESQLLQAVLLTHVGRFAEAEAAGRALLATDPANAGAHYVLAQCREGVGDPAGAAECHRLAAWLDPDFAMPRLHLGLLARRRGDMRAARRELGQALALLQREAASRLHLFGGGFDRNALLALCRTQLHACGAWP